MQRNISRCLQSSACGLVLFLSFVIFSGCAIEDETTNNVNEDELRFAIEDSIENDINLRNEINIENHNLSSIIVDYDSTVEIEDISAIDENYFFVSVTENREVFYNDNGPTMEAVLHHQFEAALEDGEWQTEFIVNGLDFSSINYIENENENSSFDEIPEELYYVDPDINFKYTYYRNDASLYAYVYALNPNSLFIYYPTADCTNFVSQAVWYGGWTMTYSYPTWWYDFGDDDHSYSWGGAHNWWFFTYLSSRGGLLSNRCDLLIGDVVQADWDPDGTIDHSMMVTYKDGCDIRVSYHTNNTRNRSLADIIDDNPDANFYYWRIY